MDNIFDNLVQNIKLVILKLCEAIMTVFDANIGGEK